MSNIRVTYSGLVSFLILLTSIFTGLVFTLIVTRRLDQTHFAIWSLIGGIISYSLIFSPISNYWLSRHIARGEQEAVTGIVSAMIFSIGATVVYFIAILFLSNLGQIDFQILFLAVILVPLTYIGTSFTAITSSYKPQGTAYAMLIFEITKIPIGFLLVYILDLGVTGAIITSITSSVIQLIFYSIYIKEKLKTNFHYSFFKNWLKLSWLPIFSNLHDRIINLDSTIFTLISGSVAGVAYIGVAKSIASLVSNTSSISVGLAPKLIAIQDIRYMEAMLDRTLLFAIPMLGIVIIFTKPGLWILNPIYVDGVYIVYLWSITHFTWVISGICKSTLESLENIDIGFKAKTKDYLKSKLFTVRLVYAICYSFYIGALILIFILSTTFGLNILETVFWWGIVSVIINVSILIIFMIMTTRHVSFEFPIRKTFKYTIITIASCLITYLPLSQYLQYDESIFEFLPYLIPYLLLFVGLYFGLIMMWDKESRNLFQQIIQELKK